LIVAIVSKLSSHLILHEHSQVVEFCSKFTPGQGLQEAGRFKDEDGIKDGETNDGEIEDKTEDDEIFDDI
jgi:hypothetical protein